MARVAAQRAERLVPGGDAETALDVLRGTGLRRAAVLELEHVAARLELWSDQPGLQVYTGNFLDGTRRRSTSGGRYRQGDGSGVEPGPRDDA